VSSDSPVVRFEASRLCLRVASVCFALGLGGALLAPSLGLGTASRAAAHVLALFGALGVFLAGSSRALLGAPRADALFQRLLMAGGVFALLLLPAEWATRLALSDVTTTGNLGSWFSQRWMAEVPLNRAGFRERELTPKAPSVYRIAVVGDSMTFAPGIERQERYTELLEAALNDPPSGTRYEVWNFGVPGVDTDQEAEVARDFALPASPDFLLLQWYVNDPMLGDRSGQPAPLALVPSQSLTTVLRGHSALFSVAEIAFSRLQQAAGTTRGFPDYMGQRFADPQSPDSRAADAALDGIFELADAKGLPAGLVIFPSLDGSSTLAFLNDRARAVCEARGLACLDLSPRLAALGDPRSLWVNRFDGHPGAAAHREVAAAIVERFGPVWRD